MDNFATLSVLEQAALLKLQEELDKAEQVRQNYAEIAREREKALLVQYQEKREFI